MAEIEIQNKAEKVAAAENRQEELKNSSKKLFGDNADNFDKLYSANIFYPIFLDNPNTNFNEFAQKIYNLVEKYSKYTKHIWSRKTYHFKGKLNELKEIFGKFKATPPPNSEVLMMVLCEYSSTILITDKNIFYVSLSEKPRKYSYEEIKNIRYVRTEGTLTYNDYININGENVASIEFDKDVVKIFSDIVEIFKLTISIKDSRNTAETELKRQKLLIRSKSSRANLKMLTNLILTYITTTRQMTKRRRKNLKRLSIVTPNFQAAKKLLYFSMQQFLEVLQTALF